MVEYVVDYLGFKERQWWSGDQDDWEPKAYPEGIRGRKASEPFNMTLTKHCNVRSKDGWRVHSMVSREETIGLDVHCMGLWVVFERERS